MAVYKFKIDEKSLYYWIYNDYDKWQTATVHTPINQSKHPEKWHNDIIALYDSWLESKHIPDILTKKCTKETTSHAKSKINYFFEFKNILLDWKPLNTDSSFWMYIKEEIDEYIINREWKSVKNTHFKRQKLHYPITLRHTNDWFNIDNEKVLKSICKQNWWFAFIVRWFECDTQNNTLNFITSIVWLEWIIKLSEVFLRKKWVWKKLLLDELAWDEINYIANNSSINQTTLFNKSSLWSEVNFEQINKSRVESGKLWEEFVLNNIKTLINPNITDIYHTSEYYPTSPYDIEYLENWIKKYLEVKSTSWTKWVFHMSMYEIKFMEQFKNDYTLIFVTDVKKQPVHHKYFYNEIKLMNHEYPTTRFFPDMK